MKNYTILLFVAFACSSSEAPAQPTRAPGPALTRAELIQLYSAVVSGMEASGLCATPSGCAVNAAGKLELYSDHLRRTLIWNETAQAKPPFPGGNIKSGL